MPTRVLPLIPAGLAVVGVVSTADHVVITSSPHQPSAACPTCAQVSQRLHSRYQRTLADLPWQGARNTIPAEITEGGRILLTVQVNDRPVSALLDSGASRSLMLSDTASRLGVGTAELAGDDQTLARGVDGGAIGVRNHSFGSLQVGADRLPSPTIGVADFQLNAADMLLGLDYLQTRRVWVSYRSGTVFAQPAGTAKPP